MPNFRVFELEERHLAQAYPLARSAAGVTSSRWYAFARETIAGGGGVLGVETENYCLYGLAAFRTLRTLRHGEALCVELLVAFELAGNRSVRAALCEGLDQIARARGLASILVTLKPGRWALGWSEDRLVVSTIGCLRQLAPARNWLAVRTLPGAPRS